MKTLIAAVAFAMALGAPAFAQSVNAWGWKGTLAAPASTKSAYAAASFNGRRGALTGRRGALRVSSKCSMPCNCSVSPGSPSYRTNCN
jgi:hypothetical protein